MNTAEILAHIDHTALKATVDLSTVKQLCAEALQWHTASVCIPASYVQRMRQQFSQELRICTVVGFPLGYCTQRVLALEAQDAVLNGADEIDMVVNLGDVKNGDFDKVTAGIRAVRAVVGGKVLKVIVETCYLTQEEKIALCGCVTDGGADYIKTSTGFGTAGAKLEDIALFKRYIGPQVRIKAAGGIRTRQAMEDFLAAGCDRIGTSSAAVLLQE